jgi:regulator of protease activity HflC (stomatin/prohibitin superfamily)
LRSLINLLLSCLFVLSGCFYEQIPPAHKAMLFDAGGMICPFGGDGLTGPVRSSGSYFAICDFAMMVDCSQDTFKETMESLTKDGAQFKIDVYVTYQTSCTEENVSAILNNVVPTDGRRIVTHEQIFGTFGRPMLGATLRAVVSEYSAPDINSEREVIFGKVSTSYIDKMKATQPAYLTIMDVQLSNMDFPDSLEAANLQRAEQAVMKDKAIAERERVAAELETAKQREALAEQEGRVEAAKIDQIGAALNRNPRYIQYVMQQQLPEIYKDAGANGNLVLAAPNAIMMAGAGGSNNGVPSLLAAP